MAFKKLKVSKNRKKTWRKHTNIDEVEEFLEEKRLEERLGDQNLGNQLFFIEKTGSAQNVDQKLVADNQKPRAKQKVKQPVKKTEQLVENLKAFRALKSCSAVKPFLITRPSAPKTPKRLKGNLSRKVAESKSCLEKEQKKRKEEKRGKENPVFYDMWNESEEGIIKDDKELKELEEIQHLLMGKNKPKISDYHYQKPSLLPAVEVPHPGSSYNPSFEDHQDLLSKAHQIELEKAKEEAHLYRVLDAYYPSAENAPTEESWLREMSQGLIGDKEKDESENELEENEEHPLLLKTSIDAGKRKSKAQRRREAMQKQLEKAAKEKRKMNAISNQIFQLDKIKKEIKEAEEKSLQRQKRKRERIISKMYKPNILSRHKFEEPDIEVSLTEDVAGSLRSLRTEGDLLKDRFSSLQKRNIIEPRKIILKHRKKHQKYFVKK
ncbi:cellular protein-like protein [Dinothrombium tinctorium]|uniref:Ribosome biogenesis protein NOP53 n=1 Tax=Dinothrombium tinctorium TaxID=1965070 RepID=A0A3S3P8G3_9ACAR|nr:cellular protein-like protein [Dinothrombium tinctorium]